MLKPPMEPQDLPDRSSDVPVFSTTVGAISLTLGLIQFPLFAVGGFYFLFSARSITVERSHLELLAVSIPIPFGAVLGVLAIFRASTNVQRCVGAFGVVLSLGWAAYVYKGF